MIIKCQTAPVCRSVEQKQTLRATDISIPLLFKITHKHSLVKITLDVSERVFLRTPQYY